MKRATPICANCLHSDIHRIAAGQDVCAHDGGCDCECYEAIFECDSVRVRANVIGSDKLLSIVLTGVRLSDFGKEG